MMIAIENHKWQKKEIGWPRLLMTCSILGDWRWVWDRFAFISLYIRSAFPLYVVRDIFASYWRIWATWPAPSFCLQHLAPFSKSGQAWSSPLWVNLHRRLSTLLYHHHFPLLLLLTTLYDLYDLYKLDKICSVSIIDWITNCASISTRWRKDVTIWGCLILIRIGCTYGLEIAIP